MKLESSATRNDLQLRLRRVEGQLRGIQKMLDDDRDCAEIAQQLSAAQAALRRRTAFRDRADQYAVRTVGDVRAIEAGMRAGHAVSPLEA